MLKNKINTCDISKTDQFNLSIKDNKKLINSNLDDKQYDINNKMSEKQKVELSNNVSNKEALKDKIHEIHNYLRNNGAGYGMNALKVFNLLYGLKKIEEKNLLDKVNLKRPDCEFSYLLKLANENKDEKLADLIRGNVLDSINDNPIKHLLLYEIPTSMKGSTFSYLIKEIEKITIIEKTCNVLLSGKIYEYFIGRDESAISELGAYFTDRHIVEYIYKKLDPKINDDGSINSMIDMFGGSGGFTTGYINYLNDKYDDINWKDNINKVYHFDMNEDVVKSAGLEFFCLTGVLPNMKDNLAYRNSFTDEFNNKKFMNVITNPPYGGDKTSQSDKQIKRKKIKEYIKQELLTLKDELIIKTRLTQIKKIEDQDKQDKRDSDKTKVSVKECSHRIVKYALDNKLTGNDKESSSLILIMDLVDVNGTAIGVLKEGVFFNKTYKDIRKCLVENFNVSEIISVPQDQFENTSTKTSIVVFHNTKEKTTTVKFSELIVERYTENKFEEINDEIVLTENKDDICGISDKLISEATKDEILKNQICSLNGKDYNKKVIVVGEGYELFKLADLVSICTSKLNSSDIDNNGNYNFYSGSAKNPVGKHSSFNFDYKEYIGLIKGGGSGEKIYGEHIGLGKVYKLSGKNAISNGMYVLLLKNNIYNDYLFYYLNSVKNNIMDIATYTTGLGNINQANLLKFQIPIPKSEQKITEWVDKISKPYDKKNKNQELIIKLEEQIKNKIKDIGENEDCDVVELSSICYINDKKITRYDTSYGKEEGTYKFHTGATDGKLFCDNFNIDKYIIILNKTNGSGKCNIFLDKNISCAKQTYICQSINNELETQYIYYYLFDKKDKLEVGYIGACHKNLSSEFLNKFKIKIPKNKKLIKDLEPLFQEIEKLQMEMTEADSQYKKLIKELSEEAIPSNKQIEIKLDNEINDISEESNVKKPIIETSEKKPKITKKKVKIQSTTV